MFGPDLADVYEAIYHSRGKSWAQEATNTARLVLTKFPGAVSLLDVACGTGAHLDTFSEFFEHVEGLEIAKPMRERAKSRLPEVTVHDGDMRDFDLGRRYDVVTCMFCSIAYLETGSELRSAVRSMSDHLVPGGVLVVEPWWFPEQFIEGYVAGDLAQTDDRTIARISHSTRKHDATHMEVRFLVGDASGIREFVEVDVLTLFEREDYVAAFDNAECSVSYLTGGPTGRGLFIGTRR